MGARTLGTTPRDPPLELWPGPRQLAALLVLTLGSSACATTLRPPPSSGSSLRERCLQLYDDPKDCVVGPRGILGVRSGTSLFWVVPAKGGVVLVDAGYDREGEAIQYVTYGIPILAILLTHAHIDHWGGAHLFDSPVYVDKEELPRFVGDEDAWAPLPWLGDVMRRPPLPAHLVPVSDGTTLTLGGLSFLAIRLRGHTVGSTAWLVGDVLFSGDAVLYKIDRHIVAPGLFSDDVAQAKRSAERLLRYRFEVMLDGHNGRDDRPQQHLRQAVQRWRAGES